MNTLSQNAYLWGVVYKLIAEEIGSDIDSVHEDLKLNFGLKKESVSIITGEVFEVKRSTTSYDTAEMSNYITKIKNWSITFLNLIIPDANSELSMYVYER